MLIELQHGEPIRFGDDGELGVVLNEFGECEIVQRRRRRRGRAPRPRRAPSRPALAFALSRLADAPTMPDAGRRVPRRRPADVRGRGAAAARRRGRSVSGPGDLAALLVDRRHLGRQLARRSSRQGSSRLRNTMPVRGLGAKNVVFCGMRRSARRRRAIWSRPRPAAAAPRRRRRPCRRAAATAASWR